MLITVLNIIYLKLFFFENINIFYLKYLFGTIFYKSVELSWCFFFHKIIAYNTE